MQQGYEITAHYTGKLLDGTVFDSSVDRGTPFKFTLGKGMYSAEADYHFDCKCANWRHVSLQTVAQMPHAFGPQFPVSPGLLSACVQLFCLCCLLVPIPDAPLFLSPLNCTPGSHHRSPVQLVQGK